MALLNPSTWSASEINAAGRHVVSYVAGGISFAVAWHFLDPATGSSISTNVGLIFDGINQTVKGVMGLMATLSSVYAGYRAVRSASPSEQVKSVITNLSAPQITQAANSVADPESRNKLISAVADMPEVKKIQADPEVAMATVSDKVVATNVGGKK